MFKIIWFLNLVCLLIALGIAAFGSGQDAAGRGALWFIVALFAVAAASSWWLDHSGSTTLATGIAILGCLVGVISAGLFVRSLRSANVAATGSAFWKEPAQRQLAVAIANGDTAAVRASISAGASPNAEGALYATPLSFAVSRRPEVVGALIKLGANPNPERNDVVSPLTIAITAADPAFQQLLDGGANPNHRDMYDTPILFTAIREGIYSRYEMLLQHGADVHARNAEGHTTVMQAVNNSQWTMALDLLGRGADKTIVGRDGIMIQTMLERMRSGNEGNADYLAVVRAFSGR